MSFAKTYSAQTVLLDGQIIDVEVDLTKGLYAFSVVGLPDKAVEESRDRVSAAIKNSGFKSPKKKNQKTVVSLAPANIKKEGPLFDLSIALAYLLAAEDISFDIEGKIFLGELSLDGKLRKIKGVLPLVIKAKEKGFQEVYLPEENVTEGAIIDGIKIYGVGELKDVVDHFDKSKEKELKPAKKTKIEYKREKHSIDFADIKGQERAKRGVEIAASGGHNIAMYGPAGTGKTMLSKAFCHILPELSFPEILEVTSIYSVSGTLEDDLIISPPFRSPHHTSSYVSLVGGGTFPKPGEITLAHKGVLFLDEFPEFERRVVESLRQPLEDRVVSISRARGSAIFPANFILVAAMNPCPCGNYGTDKTCICTPINLDRYRKKLSGPIVDRVDIWVEVGKVEHQRLTESSEGAKETEQIRRRVKKAREIQKERFKERKIKTNSEMSSRDITNSIVLTNDVKKILNDSARKLDLSARSYHKIIKLAQTIADLDNSSRIKEDHILEALQYRPKMFS